VIDEAVIGDKYRLLAGGLDERAMLSMTIEKCRWMNTESCRS